MPWRIHLMNWAAWGPTIVAAVTMIFTAGMTLGRINDQEKTLKRHDDWLLEHSGKIGHLELESAKSQGFREGLSFGNVPQSPKGIDKH
jgi:hypothetical protein